MAKRLPIVLALVGLALISLAALSFVRLSFFRVRQVSDGYVLDAHDSRSVAQSFSSHYPGLAQISIKPADAVGMPGDQIVVLSLEGPELPSPLTLTKRVQEVREGQWLNFTFGPLDDSESQNYTFYIGTPGDQPLRLEASHDNMYPEGGLVGGGDLVFQVAYNGRLLPTVAAFLSRIAEHKPGVFGQAWFYVVLFGAFGLTMGMTSVAMAHAFLRGANFDSTGKSEPSM